MNHELLQKLLDEAGLKLAYVAVKLGISRSALYRKLHGRTEFTLGEIRILIDILSLSFDQIREVFFPA